MPEDSKRIAEKIAFLEELEKLKTVTRQNKTLDGRMENSAEHSWNVALMAVVLADEFPGEVPDVRKIMGMLLIHDVVEIDAGDTFLYARTPEKNVQEKERRAAERIFGLLPSPVDGEFLSLWEEFEARETAEAKVAAALDALQPLINHVLTRAEGENLHDLRKSQIVEKKRFIGDLSPALWNVALDYIDRGVAKGLYIDD